MAGSLPGLIYPNTSVVSTMNAILIITNTKNFNLRARLLALGWDGVTAINTSVTIAGGVEVTSANVATPAFDTGAALPIGSTVTIDNRGFIVGKGAKGNTTSSNNTNAGIGLNVSTPVTIVNSGIIASGGYGGAREAINVESVFDPSQGSNGIYRHYGYGTGGGGGGAGYGDAGPRLASSGHDVDINNCTNGLPGTLLYGGAGGLGSLSNSGSGASGWPGGNLSAAYAGRPPAVTGNVNITWTAVGTIYGTLT